MVVPLLPMVFEGVIYYQGEQDVHNPQDYECLFPALIHDWRATFPPTYNDRPLPFGVVQLAGSVVVMTVVVVVVVVVVAAAAVGIVAVVLLVVVIIIR